MSSNLITRSIFSLRNPAGVIHPDVLETLFRWSKFVDEEALEEWEARLIGSEVIYTADKPVNRKRWQLSSYVMSREEADELRSKFGGGVSSVHPDEWLPSAGPDAPFILKIRSAIVVTEADEEIVLRKIQEEYPDRIILSFPPQLAFGTGSHPTTAGCLRFLVDISRARGREGWTMLDLGCGSGILAIAAAKLGAERVVAVEIDDVALRHAIRNAARHGVEDRIEFLKGDAFSLLCGKERGKFDVIAANLFSSLLVELMPNFPQGMRESGDLVISGFLTTQTREVVAAGDDAGIQFDDFLRRGKWIAAKGCLPKTND
ncbi:MAG: tRNA (adenine(22)-N(1))-methyltransferase TrmK [Verrucomicrobiales bacterium]|nr:tRNA (adenine(22)-N(1))-methyltransferase TrmK [Verrucomicrobiales bacterium]